MCRQQSSSQATPTAQHRKPKQKQHTQKQQLAAHPSPPLSIESPRIIISSSATQQQGNTSTGLVRERHQNCSDNRCIMLADCTKKGRRRSEAMKKGRRWSETVAKRKERHRQRSGSVTRYVDTHVDVEQILLMYRADWLRATASGTQKTAAGCASPPSASLRLDSSPSLSNALPSMPGPSLLRF